MQVSCVFAHWDPLKCASLFPSCVKAMYLGPYGTKVVPKMVEYARDLHGLFSININDHRFACRHIIIYLVYKLMMVSNIPRLFRYEVLSFLFVWLIKLFGNCIFVLRRWLWQIWMHLHYFLRIYKRHHEISWHIDRLICYIYSHSIINVCWLWNCLWKKVSIRCLIQN